MRNGEIILSAWELLCFTLFKALATPSLFTISAQSPFFTETYDDMEDENGQVNIFNLMEKVRMDKHRMLVVLLTRLLRKLILLLNE